MPSSVSSFPSEGNFPPTTRPFFEEVGTSPPALDLVATDFLAVVFFTDVESGALALAAADAEGALLVETIGEERDEGRAAAAAIEGVRRAVRANMGGEVEF